MDKRDRRRIEREKFFGPEHTVVIRTGLSETLSCGHTLEFPPATTKPPKVRRCVKCIPGYDPINPPVWEPKNQNDVE